MKNIYSSLVVTLFFVLVLSSRSVIAQEVDYTQYYLNLSGFNPGFTGVEDHLDLKLAYRQGWNGFGVKNNDVFVSAYGALGTSSQFSSNRNSLRISNPEALGRIQDNQQKRRRHGLGGMVTSRTVGPYTSVSINGNYAYHLPISRKVNVALGTRVAYGSQRIDYNSLTVRDPVTDVFYQQLLQSNPGNQSFVSVDFGSVIYSNRFYAGLSSTNLGLKSLSGDNGLSLENKRQFGLQAGAILPVGGQWSLNSGGRLVEMAGYNLIWSVNSRLRYKDLLYFGAGYTHDSKISMLLGLSLTNRFSVNYAYDHYFSGQSNLNVNVHELVIGIGMFTKYDSKTKFW